MTRPAEASAPEALARLTRRVRERPGVGGRLVLGIAGAPGAGKSTLAELVVRTVDDAVLVPMDGFHLAQAELRRLGRADRKGAPDTFDRGGFVALLERVRAADASVYAPTFDRSLEEPIAGSILVPATAPLVVVEGNYLLLWPQVRPLLDETWWVEVDDDLRRDRLVARHVAYGKDPSLARAWVLGSDEANARTVASGRSDADWLIRVIAG